MAQNNDKHPIDDLQRGWVMGQIRKELRIIERKTASLKEKFKNEANTQKLDGKREWLEAFYTQLGGDVSQITNLDGRPANLGRQGQQPAVSRG